MCTLIVGVDILGPATLVLGTNRDENPDRPSDPPRVLVEQPRIEGGRDRVAGGTWLAVRERRAAVAMLNRRTSAESAPTLAKPSAPEPARRSRARPSSESSGHTPAAAPDASLRSRGLLTLDVAAAEVGDDASDETLSQAARAALTRALAAARYAPFSLVFVSPRTSWVASHDPGHEPLVRALSPGWHVLTHADLDDSSEPRTARLQRGLAGWQPRSVGETLNGLIARLALHDEGGDEAPAVCIHGGPMVTVSSAIVTLGGGADHYLHFEGRPCQAARLGSIHPGH